MHTSKDWRHEKKHEENLRLKLRREMPEELVESCETYGQLEAKIAVVDAIHNQEKKPCRTTEKRKALHYEEVADQPVDEVLAEGSADR